MDCENGESAQLKKLQQFMLIPTQEVEYMQQKCAKFLMVTKETTHADIGSAQKYCIKNYLVTKVHCVESTIPQLSQLNFLKITDT